MWGTLDDHGRVLRRPHRSNGSRHSGPLRTIREWMGEVLRDLDRDCRTRVATTGRPSIPSEPLWGARLHVLYSVWREWQLMAPLDPNLLFRGLV
jgi:hypothetical protein